MLGVLHAGDPVPVGLADGTLASLRFAAGGERGRSVASDHSETNAAAGRLRSGPRRMKCSSPHCCDGGVARGDGGGGLSLLPLELPKEF